jgi:hypothetical protein
MLILKCILNWSPALIRPRAWCLIHSSYSSNMDFLKYHIITCFVASTLPLPKELLSVKHHHWLHYGACKELKKSFLLDLLNQNLHFYLTPRWFVCYYKVKSFSLEYNVQAILFDLQSSLRFGPCLLHFPCSFSKYKLSIFLPTH